MYVSIQLDLINRLSDLLVTNVGNGDKVLLPRTVFYPELTLNSLKHSGDATVVYKDGLEKRNVGPVSANSSPPHRDGDFDPSL